MVGHLAKRGVPEQLLHVVDQFWVATKGVLQEGNPARRGRPSVGGVFDAGHLGAPRVLVVRPQRSGAQVDDAGRCVQVIRVGIQQVSDHLEVAVALGQLDHAEQRCLRQGPLAERDRRRVDLRQCFGHVAGHLGGGTVVGVLFPLLPCPVEPPLDLRAVPEVVTRTVHQRNSIRGLGHAVVGLRCRGRRLPGCAGDWPDRDHVGRWIAGIRMPHHDFNPVPHWCVTVSSQFRRQVAFRLACRRDDGVSSVTLDGPSRHRANRPADPAGAHLAVARLDDVQPVQVLLARQTSCAPCAFPPDGLAVVPVVPALVGMVSLPLLGQRQRVPAVRLVGERPAAGVGHLGHRLDVQAVGVNACLAQPFVHLGQRHRPARAHLALHVEGRASGAVLVVECHHDPQDARQVEHRIDLCATGFRDGANQLLPPLQQRGQVGVGQVLLGVDDPVGLDAVTGVHDECRCLAENFGQVGDDRIGHFVGGAAALFDIKVGVQRGESRDIGCLAAPRLHPRANGIHTDPDVGVLGQLLDVGGDQVGRQQDADHLARLLPFDQRGGDVVDGKAFSWLGIQCGDLVGNVHCGCAPCLLVSSGRGD